MTVHSPVEVAQGEAFCVEVRTTKAISSIEGKLDGKPVYFYGLQRRLFASVGGMDLATTPGSYQFRIRVEDSDGGLHERVFQVKVKRVMFGVQRLTLPEEQVELKGEILRRFLKESGQVKEVMRVVRPKRLWQGSFVVPVEGEITGAFGLRRILNDKPRSPHSGVDIAAPLGTPVRACNDGLTVFSRELYLSGKTIVIDHGLGLYSIYMHLADARVNEGHRVGGKDIIGHVGASGRATGPHLHWGVRLLEARIDPFSLLRLFPPGGKAYGRQGI